MKDQPHPVKQPDDLSQCDALDLLDEYARLTRAGFNNPNPIGRSEAYMARVARRQLLEDELKKRLGKDPHS